MATRFKFKLDTLLKVRRLAEQQKQRIVAERLRQIELCQRLAESMNGQLVHAVSRAQALGAEERLDVPLLSRQRYWISKLQRDLLEAELETGRLEEQLRRERSDLTEASRQVKVLEKLRDKALERHLGDLARLETKDADEIAVQGFNRRNKTGLSQCAKF